MTAADASTAASEVIAGVRTAVAGLRLWAREPRLLGLGVLPGVVVAAGMSIVLGVLLFNLGAIGSGLADALGVDGGRWHGLVSVTAAAAVLAASAVISVALFASLTLTVGQPFFEAISRRVDEVAGGLEGAEAEEGWGASLARGLREGALTLAISIAMSLALLLVGLIPVVGAGAAFALGAVLGGRLLAIELTAYPWARRGVLARRDRVRLLTRHRLRVMAFGATIFLVFLLPLGAVLAMPAAVAGATLLARDTEAAR
ncbi:EI24 domain-containing protein [Demequina mangrovi]|uniref:CysZ protein n=1 Tax=Demequina mangrovi TaxID=1043493 RepID=A0A1H6U1Y1_9MICO|nr:EI24 domain-containing protein [Demequina mangrovi]SEI84504.1 CysZ protein [Demequina mangrovi]